MKRVAIMQNKMMYAKLNKPLIVLWQPWLGDRDYYEEVLRALYARDSHRFHQLIESWPATEGDPTTARKVTLMKDDVTVNPCRDESLRAANGCY